MSLNKLYDLSACVCVSMRVIGKPALLSFHKGFITSNSKMWLRYFGILFFGMRFKEIERLSSTDNSSEN